MTRKEILEAAAAIVTKDREEQYGRDLMRMCRPILSESEKWMTIPGYEKEYMISDKGKVKSIERRVLRKNGWPQTIRERILKPYLDECGYPQVRLRGKTFKVHRLMANVFLGPRPSGFVVRHKDGNPQNNALVNLGYGTQSQNVLDCYEYRGYISKNQKLKPGDVVEIRQRIRSGESGTALAAEFSVSKQNICDIKNYRTFAWLEEAI